MLLLCSIASLTKASEITEIPIGLTETALSPLAGEPASLLTNGDFEAGENGVPENWSSKKYDATAGAWLISGSPAQNGKAVKLTGGTGVASYPFVQQGIPVEGGATYQLSLWLYKDGGKSAATTKLEFYASAVTGTVCVQGANTYKITSTNGWEQVLYNFRAPYTATSVLIMPRIESESETAYYDDVKVYKVGPPSPVNLTTDSVFYYPEQKTGTAILSVSELVLPAARGGTAQFSLLDGESILQTKAVPLGNDLCAAFSFDTSLLSVYKKAYTVKVHVQDKNGETLAERAQAVYKFARPKYLDKSGLWHNGAENFTPVICYKVPPTDAAYIKCKKAGITVVQGSVSDLPRANSHGLKVLVTLYNGMQPAGAEVNRAYTKEVVEKYKNDPRVFAWAIMDEPHLNLPEPMDALLESYRIIREIDDNHPVYICEASPQHFADSAKACDLLCTDPYLPGSTTAAGKMNTTHVYDYVQKARAASGYLKPVLSLNQAFTWYRYLPDGMAARHMIYQALFAGASAHGYYNFAKAAEENGEKVPLYAVTSTDIWAGLTGFAETEKADAYAHFVEEKTAGFSHYVGKELLYHGYVQNGKLRIIVLNQSIKDTVQARIPLVSFDKSLQIGAYTAKYIAGGEGSFSGERSLDLTLSPYQAAVLELTPSGMRLDGLSKKAFRAYVEGIRRKENTDVPNGSMEVLKNGVPTDFTVSGACEAYTESVFDGKYSLHLWGDATVKTNAKLRGNVPTDISVYAKVNGKIKLSVRCGDVLLGETEEISGDGTTWQKVMVPLLPQTEDMEAEICITHTGSGALIDAVCAKNTENLIRNGDFEGKMNDNTPAGDWICAEGFGTSAYLQKEDDSTALCIGGAKTGVTTEVGLIKDRLYGLTLDTKGSAAALEIGGITEICRIGASPAGEDAWVENFQYYFTAPETKTYSVTLFSIENATAMFDNVSLYEIPADGIKTETKGDVITAKTALPFDDTKETVTFALCAYDADGRLLDIQMEQKETAFCALRDENVRVNYVTGEIPAICALTLPQNGAAYYKAFLWAGLCPRDMQKMVPDE